MKTTIIAVGKLKERFWREAQQEYVKRLGAGTTLTLIELPDRNPAQGGAQRALYQEGEAVLRAVPKGAWLIALCVEGQPRSSTGLAAHFEELKNAGQSHLCFVLGSSHGLSSSVLDRVDEELSFGPVTLPHNLARVVLLEQLYRAACISAGKPYHK